MLKRTVPMRVFLAASLIFAGILSEQTVAAGVEKTSVIPFCAAKNLTEKSLVLWGPEKGKKYVYVPGIWKISLIFTNHGKAACSLSGVPRAQPVVGTDQTPVGPIAHPGVIRGWKNLGVSAVLGARKGTATIRYQMLIPATSYRAGGCASRNADGVVITFYNSTKALLSSYFRTVKNQVCTDWLSTSLTGEVPIRYGRSAAMDCTLMWAMDGALWIWYRGQSVDDALQASAAAFSEYGPVVFEKWTVSDLHPSSGIGGTSTGNAGSCALGICADTPWYLAFTKEGHKGLGLVFAQLRTDGTAEAFLGPYCQEALETGVQ